MELTENEAEAKTVCFELSSASSARARKKGRALDPKVSDQSC